MNGSTKKCFITFSCELCSKHHVSSYDSLRLRKYKTYCSKCSSKVSGKTKTDSLEDVIKECQIKYDNFYTYSIDAKSYINKKSLIKIICPLHGEFEKSVQKHLSGQACFRCRMDQLIIEGRLKGSYTEKYFIDHPEEIDKEAVLYYIKIGKMYKIGITTNLYNRMKSLKSLFKLPVEIIDTYESNLKDVYEIEQKIINLFETERIFTKQSTELFKYDILKSSIKNVL